VTDPDPGRILRRALMAWGSGHLLLGRTAVGRVLLLAEVIGLLLVAWLTIGLATSSAYLVPFLAGVVFLVAWAWQAVAAYRDAQAMQAARSPTPERSPATAIGWLSIPLLVWGAGFWLVGAHAATPAATLDRFVSAWTAGDLDADEWPPSVIQAASEAEASLGSGPDKFQDVRFSVIAESNVDASALGESVHFERQETTLLGVFSGTELVPVADQRLLSLELAAQPVELPGGGDVGAVRWELVDASSP
jgi:hypothetical protein